MKQNVLFILALLFCLDSNVLGVHLRKKEAKQSQQQVAFARLTSKSHDYEAFVKELTEDLKNSDFLKYLREKLNTKDAVIPMDLNASGKDLGLSQKAKNKWTNKYGLNLVAIPVKNLKPTQKEIGLENSLSYVLENGCTDVFNGQPQLIASPIITYNSKYVLDGHHRWSQLFFINPNAQIIAFDFKKANGIPDEEPPMVMLEKLQIAIASIFGKVPSSTASNNINVYAAHQGVIRDYLYKNLVEKNNLLDLVDSRLKGKSVNNAELNQKKQKVFNYFVKTINYFIQLTKPTTDVPTRDLMPQTGGPDNIEIDKVDPKLLTDVFTDNTHTKTNAIQPIVVNSLKVGSLKLPA